MVVRFLPNKSYFPIICLMNFEVFVVQNVISGKNFDTGISYNSFYTLLVGPEDYARSMRNVTQEEFHSPIDKILHR